MKSGLPDSISSRRHIEILLAGTRLSIFSFWVMVVFPSIVSPFSWRPCRRCHCWAIPWFPLSCWTANHITNSGVDLLHTHFAIVGLKCGSSGKLTPTEPCLLRAVPIRRSFYGNTRRNSCDNVTGTFVPWPVFTLVTRGVEDKALRAPMMLHLWVVGYEQVLGFFGSLSFRSNLRHPCGFPVRLMWRTRGLDTQRTNHTFNCSMALFFLAVWKVHVSGATQVGLQTSRWPCCLGEERKDMGHVAILPSQ